MTHWVDMAPDDPERRRLYFSALARQELALEQRRRNRDKSGFVARWLGGGFLILAICVLCALAWAVRADAHWQPGRHNAIHAIQLNFGPHWRDAADVSHCEAGAFQWQIAGRPQDSGNGQYKGLFQMGDWARGKFGHGPGVWAQAEAAAKNFRSNGRSWRGQWGCQPYTNPMPSWLLPRLGFRSG